MKQRKAHLITNGLEYKYCTACKIFLELKLFPKNKNTWDGLQNQCSPCKGKKAKKLNADNPKPNRERAKLWAQNNQENCASYQKEYRSNNKESLSQYHGQYRKDNKDYFRERSRLDKQKRRQNPSYKLLENMRNRLSKTMKGLDKSAGTINLVGCDVLTLRSYLESLFQEGMSWENYGEWHVDHIVPCSSFDLSKETEQQKCFHYTNLQPLWRIDNLKKGTSVIPSNKFQKLYPNEK